MGKKKLSAHNLLTPGGVLVSLGIIYGDIGTSPIYTLRFIVGDQPISKELILGGLSCIFWTLTIITTIKYVYLALNADNKGEGGIFALYALVRKYKATWLLFPAIIGCCTLIADGFITPAISVTSAIEGLRTLYPSIDQQTIITIVIVILMLLFFYQQFGTRMVGGTFGPIMLVWFLFIGIVGGIHLSNNWTVLHAVNPLHAWYLLTQYPDGFWLLGAVFLCTTGAEAMYSDLGHCGKKNIRAGWVMVMGCLLLSYFGQGAWLLQHEGETLGTSIPFFAMIPSSFQVFGVILAVFSTIIASQALISGVFTLVNEAIKLRLWPSTLVRYPSRTKGQVYLPAINWLLMGGSMVVVLAFRESQAMEAAYGLAITFDMLITTLLLVFYFSVSHRSWFRAGIMMITFLTVEGTFLLSNLNKFSHGGWFTFIISMIFFMMMYTIHRARGIRDRRTEFVDLNQYIPMLKDLQEDNSVPKEATHLVYMASADSNQFIDSNIIYSIFKKRPKRADTYWFLHVDTLDSPYSSKYSVYTVIPKRCFFVRIQLGFKVDHRISILFNRILLDLSESNEIDLVSHYNSLRRYSMPADFKFIILHSMASADSDMSSFENLIIQTYRIIKEYSLSAEEMYGLELANVELERVPIRVGPTAKVRIKRER